MLTMKKLNTHIIQTFLLHETRPFIHPFSTSYLEYLEKKPLSWTNANGKQNNKDISLHIETLDSLVQFPNAALATFHKQQMLYVFI